LKNMLFKAEKPVLHISSENARFLNGLFLKDQELMKELIGFKYL